MMGIWNRAKLAGFSGGIINRMGRIRENMNLQ
jgi:hypothetical protein